MSIPVFRHRAHRNRGQNLKYAFGPKSFVNLVASAPRERTIDHAQSTRPRDLPSYHTIGKILHHAVRIRATISKRARTHTHSASHEPEPHASYQPAGQVRIAQCESQKRHTALGSPSCGCTTRRRSGSASVQ